MAIQRGKFFLQALESITLTTETAVALVWKLILESNFLLYARSPGTRATISKNMADLRLWKELCKYIQLQSRSVEVAALCQRINFSELEGWAWRGASVRAFAMATDFGTGKKRHFGILIAPGQILVVLLGYDLSMEEDLPTLQD